jgi:hypothetical protein
VTSDLQREKQVGLNSATRFFEIEIGERRVVWTGASEQQVIDRGGQLVEELREALEVGRIEGYSARRGELTRYVLKPLGIPSGEHKLGPLRMR